MKIAIVPGDGIGGEVIAAMLPTLTFLDETFGLGLGYEIFDWGAEKWLSSGVGLPDGALEALPAEYDALLLGALGDPRIPDMAHGRAILLGLRRGLDLYVNYRPVFIAGREVHLYRENTQGLYSGVGGTVARGLTSEVAVDECIYTRGAVERFVRFCLGELSCAGRAKVTLVHKANAVPNTGQLWLDVFRTELAAFPSLTGSDEYVDSFCYRFIRDPSGYEGILAPNLLGDIISDIGAALMGGLGLAPSASLCPETGFGLFEPVHGSAPDIAGRGTANPYGAAMSAVLMLRHLGANDAGNLLLRCLEQTVQSDAVTPDMGGRGTTEGFMRAVLETARKAILLPDYEASISSLAGKYERRIAEDGIAI